MSDSMGQETLEALIDDYRRAHPEFQPPEKSDHPIVLALTTDMNPELIDRCGNIVIFWDLLLDAAIDYFDPLEDSLEFNYFRSRLFTGSGMAAGTIHDEGFSAIWQRYRKWIEGG
mgnify:CR=1 FL=1